MSNELKHYGILGMKWGVRRYQNYDGSYTKKGLQRYEKAREDYESKKAAYKEGHGSKSDVKGAKKELIKRYKQLSKDKLADEGRELYRSGKTITDTTLTTGRIETAIVVGSGIANQLLGRYTDQRTATLASGAIAAGGTAVNLILAGKANYEAKRLRAYYAH